MARKPVSTMSAEEKEKFFGKKKKFIPLFQVPEKKLKSKKTKEKVKPKKEVKPGKLFKSKGKVSKQKKSSTKKKKIAPTSPVISTKVQITPTSKIYLKRRKFKSLEGQTGLNFLVEFYSKIVEKKRSKEKEIEAIRNTKASGVLIYLHENTSKENKNMMNILVEKGYAKIRAYSMDQIIYEIFR